MYNLKANKYTINKIFFNDKTTTLGISCLFKTRYTKAIENMMNQNFSIILKMVKTEDRIQGKEFYIPKTT